MVGALSFGGGPGGIERARSENALQRRISRFAEMTTEIDDAIADHGAV
jgi:hypothetical protein